MSEETAQAVDREIRKLVVKAEATALRILGDNEDKLHSLARSLLAYEVLDDAEIDQVLAGETLTREPVRVLSDEDEA